jgi:hypothetical protein
VLSEAEGTVPSDRSPAAFARNVLISPTKLPHEAYHSSRRSPQLHFEEIEPMKTIYRLAAFLLKPTAMDAYLTSLRQSSKPILEEQKRNGTIMDYKVFLKETKHSPDDWDL